MSAISLIDTTIFMEILRVPEKTNNHAEIYNEFQQKIDEGEDFLLPMTTILETGNHIAQNGDGTQRRKCAERFVEHVQAALAGEAPYAISELPAGDAFRQWLAAYPDSAMRGEGLGDLSIIHEWNRQCALNHGRRVYIWSLDEHLSGHDRAARI